MIVERKKLEDILLDFINNMSLLNMVGLNLYYLYLWRKLIVCYFLRWFLKFNLF